MNKCAIALMLLGLLGLSACAPQAAPQDGEQTAYQTISAEEAKEMMDTTADYLLLDVRTAEEYTAQHIEGALLLPDDRIASDAAQVLPDPGQTILVYCRSGRRSAAASQALAALGYTNVYDFGGILDWPYDTVSGPPAQTPSDF